MYPFDTPVGVRVSVSLTLWLVVLSTLVLILQGWRQLDEEEQDLYAAASRELTLVAIALRSSVENAIRDGQETDIGSLLEQLELRDPTFDVFVFRGADLLGMSFGSAANLDTAQSIARRGQALRTLWVQRLPEGILAAAAPVRVGGDVIGHVVIMRPPDALQSDLEGERAAVVVSVAILVVMLAVVIWAVVKLRLQRPISQVIKAVRRIAEGDLSARIRQTGSDELAELAREFDATIDALEATRLQLSHEAETRERLEGEMLRTNRLAIVGQLAATLAHEVGSPLQVLGGRARDIVRRTDLPDDVVRSAGIIADQVDRLHGIVERFLDVARRKGPIVENVGLQGAVGEVVELLALQARRADVRLKVDVREGLTVRADPPQLQQVLLNLVQNALRASQRGATVHILAQPSSFRRVPEGAEQAAIALVVEDEGPGIPEGLREVVFQPFFTGWNADSAPSAGTGLGLSVVQSIVNDHGGIVEIHTGRNGRGTRFVAQFPITGETTATMVRRTVGREAAT